MDTKSTDSISTNSNLQPGFLNRNTNGVTPHDATSFFDVIQSHSLTVNNKFKQLENDQLRKSSSQRGQSSETDHSQSHATQDHRTNTTDANSSNVNDRSDSSYSTHEDRRVEESSSQADKNYQADSQTQASQAEKAKQEQDSQDQADENGEDVIQELKATVAIEEVAAGEAETDQAVTKVDADSESQSEAQNLVSDDLTELSDANDEGKQEPGTSELNEAQTVEDLTEDGLESPLNEEVEQPLLQETEGAAETTVVENSEANRNSGNSNQTDAEEQEIAELASLQESEAADAESKLVVEENVDAKQEETQTEQTDLEADVELQNVSDDHSSGNDREQQSSRQSNAAENKPSAQQEAADDQVVEKQFNQQLATNAQTQEKPGAEVKQPVAVQAETTNQTNSGSASDLTSSMENRSIQRGLLQKGIASSEARPVDMRQVRLIQRVAKAFQVSQVNQGPIRLRLSPPELGALKIEIDLKDGAMTAKIETETQAARQILMENLPQLKDRLAEMDITVDTFEVDQMNQESAGQQRDENGSLDKEASGQQSNPNQETQTEEVAEESEENSADALINSPVTSDGTINVTA